MGRTMMLLYILQGFTALQLVSILLFTIYIFLEMRKGNNDE